MRPDPRQLALLAVGTATPTAADDDTCDRDLFGEPIAPTHGRAPKYRPRAPVQQSLDLAPGTFALGGRK